MCTHTGTPIHTHAQCTNILHAVHIHIRTIKKCNRCIKCMHIHPSIPTHHHSEQMDREGDSAVQWQNPNIGMALSEQDSLLVATWNVRTLVESVGGYHHICRSRPQYTTVDSAQIASSHLVDWKLDLLLKELRRIAYRYNMQESRKPSGLGRTCGNLMAICFLILVAHCVRKG